MDVDDDNDDYKMIPIRFIDADDVAALRKMDVVGCYFNVDSNDRIKSRVQKFGAVAQSILTELNKLELNTCITNQTKTPGGSTQKGRPQQRFVKVEVEHDKVLYRTENFATSSGTRCS